MYSYLEINLHLPWIIVLVCVVLGLVALGLLYYKHRRKCSRIEFRSVDGMKFYVCHGGPVGAWHNPKKGIYISDRLLEVLNRKELKAVYYHEKGHEKNVRIGYLSKDIAVIWLSLFLAVFLAASNVWDLLGILEDPLPPTHPPLWLRIYKILRESKNTQN
jgi:hypothetical protein